MPLAQEVTLFRFMHSYLELQMLEVTEEEMDDQPAPGINPPRWLLGHLAIANDGALRRLGQPVLCGEDWHASFGRGSKPTQLSVHPTKQMLLDVLSQGVTEICTACEAVPADTLQQPHDVAFFAQTPVSTVGDLIAHLMTTHIALHVGQLTCWRRLKGRAPMF